MAFEEVLALAVYPADQHIELVFESFHEVYQVLLLVNKELLDVCFQVKFLASERLRCTSKYLTFH